MVTPKTERSKLWITKWTLDADEGQLVDVVCELDGYPGWSIRPDVLITDTGLLLRGLRIEPADPGILPPGGITTRMLRELRTGDLIASLRAAARQAEKYLGTSPDLSVSTRVGRRGRDDRYYAEWAAAYADALTRSAQPVLELASSKGISASQVRNLIHACRKRGLLTPSPSGRAGGDLTPRARALLKEES